MTVDGITSACSMQEYLKSQALSGGTGSEFSDVLSTEIAELDSEGQSALDIQNEGLSTLLTGFSGMNGVLMNLLLNACLSEDSENSGLVSLDGGGTRSWTRSSIPNEAWKPVFPTVTSSSGNRSRELYQKVIDQFQVETNQRYEPDDNTYCNIFVWDVTRAMNAEIPHYIDAETNEPMRYGESGASQTSANAVYRWLRQSGETYGWHEVGAQQAQSLANQGKPVVAAKYSGIGSGHVQMVCPSEDGRYNPDRGVTVAQAGRNLTSYAPITEIYGKDLSGVRYFAHV